MVRVRTRRWSNDHGAGRVTATARGVQRTVRWDPVTSGGMSGDGTHGDAVRVLLDALGVPQPAYLAPAYVRGPVRVYLVSTVTTTDEENEL